MTRVLERLMGAEIIPFPTPTYEELQRKLAEIERQRVEAENAYWNQERQRQWRPSLLELERLGLGQFGPQIYNPITDTYSYPDGRQVTRIEKDWWRR